MVKCFQIGVRESEFGGGCPDVYITVNEGVISLIEFDNEFEGSNYSWSVQGWEYAKFIGKPVSELEDFVREYNQQDYGDYRDPYMFMREVDCPPPYVMAQYYTLSW